MKARILIDVFPWTKPGTLYPMDADTSFVGDKPLGAVRYLVEVEIPEPVLPDVVLQGEAKEMMP